MDTTDDTNDIGILDSEGNQIAVIEEPLATEVTRMAVQKYIIDSIMMLALEDKKPLERLDTIISIGSGSLNMRDLKAIQHHIKDIELALDQCRQANTLLRRKRDGEERVVGTMVMGGHTHDIVQGVDNGNLA